MWGRLEVRTSMMNCTHRMKRHSHNNPSVPLPHPQRRNWRSTATTVTYVIGIGFLTATKLFGEKQHIGDYLFITQKGVFCRDELAEDDCEKAFTVLVFYCSATRSIFAHAVPRKGHNQVLGLEGYLI